MADVELELPFAENLRPIAQGVLSELFGGVNDDSRDRFILPEAVKVTDYVGTLRDTHGSSLKRRQTSDAVVRSIEIFPAWVIAYMLLQPNNPFQRWSDVDKRYLLDRALGTEIVGAISSDERISAQRAYYSQVSNFGPDEKFLSQLRGFQERLRARTTPTPGHMKR